MPLKLEVVLLVVQHFCTLQRNFCKFNEIVENYNRERAASSGFLIQMMWCCLTSQSIILTALLIKLNESIRSVWHLNRTSTFWEIDCQKHGEAFFKSNFRMGRSSFRKLCNYMQGMEKNDTNFRMAICLEKRIAIALYALGSSAEYRTVANMFGVSAPTVCRIVLEFCKEVCDVLLPIMFTDFPLTEQKIRNLVSGFERLGFPQCIGAIDGCHIQIHPLKAEAVDYFNYKGWYSTILLALVDSNYRFIYINVGTPGRCNDSSIYEKSNLKYELENCHLLQEMSIPLGSINVPIVILGDSAFRLSKNLMKPFAFNVNNTEQQRKFNFQLSKCRRVVENAFGHLKARFRRVGKGIDNNIKNVNDIIKACCVLHNFLIEEKDEVPASWIAEQNIIERDRRNPRYSLRTNLRNNAAEDIRGAFTSYFSRIPDEAIGEEIGDGDGLHGIEASGEGDGVDRTGDDGGT